MRHRAVRRRAASIILALLCPWLALSIEPEPIAPSLARVKRVYVEQLGGGPTSDQMRDMIIAALQNTRLFVVTDNPDRADAILRGSSDDKIFTEDHTSSDSLGVSANLGGTTYSSSSSSRSSSQKAGARISDNENSRIQERRHEASASLRLVNSDGDVIWSTTQESSGGKFRGAMADVADKVVRLLAEETRGARADPGVGTHP
jgi:hypothetical protein